MSGRNFLAAHYFLGLVYLQKRQYQDAANNFQKAATISNNHPATITGIARTLAMSGRRDDALKILGEVEESAGRRYVAPYYLAVSYLALGNRERTLQWLERAYEERSPYMSNLQRDPEFDAIQSDSAFVRLLRHAGFSAKRQASVGRNSKVKGKARDARRRR